MNVQAKKFNKNGAIKENDFSLIEYCNFLKSKYRLNKKVLFVQIPQFIFKTFNYEIARKKGYYAFPPTGLQCLYEALKVKNRDLELRILDLNFMLLKRISEDETFDRRQWMRILKDYLESFSPFIIGVSCMYDSGIQPLVEILEFLKKRNESVLITGGVIPSYEWQNFLSRDLCHFVVRGEGENKINYLFDQLTEENQNNLATPGIYYKYQNKYLKSQGKPDVVALQGDLIDSYSLIAIEEYYKYGSLNPFSRMSGVDKSPFATIQMSRGCRGNCTFCSVGDFMGRGVRKREVNSVLEGMEFLINRRGVRHFEWLDDDLLFFKKDFQFLLGKIIENKWNIVWSANNGLIATSIDDKTMQLIRDSGCVGFKIGIETGNADMLKRIKKPASLDNFRKASAIFNNYPEVFVGGNFMLGFPNERFQQMMDSFRFYLEMNLDWAAFTICQVIRGATAFSDFEDYFKVQMDSDNKNIKNFIPTRESAKGELSVNDDVLKGLDVFKIEVNCVPTEAQIKEIWFTFNLVGNFINNKNLRPEGRVEKFISWVEMAQLAYPTNPYMSLFLSLAYIIKGGQDNSRDYYNKAALIIQQSGYWKERFVSFGLMEVMDKSPQTKSEVFKTMEKLRKFTSSCY